MPPRFPFLKDKPPALPLVVVEQPKRNVYSPLSIGSRPRLSQFPKCPIQITLPWAMTSTKTIVQQVIDEYQTAFPGELNPSTTDLLEWLRNRAINAEQHADGLDKEVNRLEDKIQEMEADLRIRSASHGI